MNEPFVMEIKSGWLARGKGWAVQAPTREAALGAYQDAEEWHRIVDARPLPGMTDSEAATPTSESDPNA